MTLNQPSFNFVCVCVCVKDDNIIGINFWIQQQPHGGEASRVILHLMSHKFKVVYMELLHKWTYMLKRQIDFIFDKVSMNVIVKQDHCLARINSYKRVITHKMEALINVIITAPLVMGKLFTKFMKKLG